MTRQPAFRTIAVLAGVVALAAAPAGCADDAPSAAQQTPPVSAAPAAAAAAAPAPTMYTYRVVNRFPHDPNAFTQGLVFHEGVLYESTGLNGQSSLRRVSLETGEVLARRDIDARYFAEGLALWRDSLIQLTWQAGTAFVYDRSSLEPTGTLSYTGEGWGLASDGQKLILSDGGPDGELRFLDPETFAETGRLVVRDRGAPVNFLNELEVVGDEIFANVWQTERIARISPETGDVTGWIDLTGLLPAAERSHPDAVLNGIAWDAANDRLFVTGKLWPTLFEIRLERR